MKKRISTDKMDRRRLLTGTATLGAGLITAKAAADICSIPTPTQTEGPFYPEIAQKDKDWDLTSYEGKVLSGSQYTFVHIKGVVKDIECELLPKSMVEIWQADINGIYKHRRDARFGQHDKLFQFWGRSLVNANAEFEFRTIKPAPYPIGGGEFRTPHIHIKVHPPGGKTLTSQLYFANEPLNENDIIYSNLTQRQKELVTIDFQPDVQGVLQGSVELFVDPDGRQFSTPLLD